MYVAATAQLLQRWHIQTHAKMGQTHHVVWDHGEK
jgi:hypothetical protein